MEDEDIAPNTYGTGDPVGMGRKARQYNYIPVIKYRLYWHDYSHLCSLDQLTASGAESSSNILCPIL